MIAFYETNFHETVCLLKLRIIVNLSHVMRHWYQRNAPEILPIDALIAITGRLLSFISIKLVN